MSAGTQDDRGTLLREGLLDGLRVLVATAPGGGSAASAIERRCAALGAALASVEVVPSAEAPEEGGAGAAVEDLLGQMEGAEVLLVDTAALFAAAGGEQALLAAMQTSWEVTRAVGAGAMIEKGGGLVVLLAPAPGAGPHAEAARAGVENLARTLSIEWARFATRAVAVAPGDATRPEELADVVAYLASAAGDYYSGCLLDLRGAGTPPPV